MEICGHLREYKFMHSFLDSFLIQSAVTDCRLKQFVIIYSIAQFYKWKISPPKYCFKNKQKYFNLLWPNVVKLLHGDESLDFLWLTLLCEIHLLTSFYQVKGLTVHLCRINYWVLRCKKYSLIFRHFITFQILLFSMLIVASLIFYFIFRFPPKYVYFKVLSNCEFYCSL